MKVEVYLEPNGDDLEITLIYDFTTPISPELDALDKLGDPVEEWYLASTVSALGVPA